MPGQELGQQQTTVLLLGVAFSIHCEIIFLSDTLCFDCPLDAFLLVFGQVQTEREKVTYQKDLPEENRVYRSMFVKRKRE